MEWIDLQPRKEGKERKHPPTENRYKNEQLLTKMIKRLRAETTQRVTSKTLQAIVLNTPFMNHVCEKFVHIVYFTQT